MALSVLPKNKQRSEYGVWDSELKDYIFSGTETQCYTQKHKLEDQEQQQQNGAYFASLAAERRNLMPEGI